jgi:predicted metal-binding protein
MDPDKLILLKELAQLGDVTYTMKSTKCFITVEEQVELSKQAEAILFFLQKLDIDMVNSILEDNRTYQEFKKRTFINKLDDAVDEFIRAGDTYLNRHSGFCNSEQCNFKSKGYSFIGNNSNNYFDLIFDIKDGVVHDIYECTKFKC